MVSQKKCIVRKAKEKVKQALKKDILKKLPCQICGEIKVIAHHSDYSNPLDVIWLCRKHHITLHKVWNNRDENTNSKISKSLKGRILSEEHKESISKKMLGKKHSLKTKKKISQSLKEYNNHAK